VSVRPARADDEERLLAIDRATWSLDSSPAPAPSDGPFFNERTQPEAVLVAELDAEVVGWGKIQHPTELPASEHVWHVTGLAVDPAFAGRGVGRALMEALMEMARERGGSRMTLRVFATNPRALRLYERLGFELEGVFRGEFKLGTGEFVDDLFMARSL
jgi:ribosomal protein S18 acetylase RimI-like enzyme